MGGVAYVRAVPQCRFTGRRLIIVPTPGAYHATGVPFHPFEILDIIVGENSQMIDANPIPGWIFSAHIPDGKMGAYKGERITMDTAEISQEIRLKVRNRDVANHAFCGAIWGRVEKNE